MKIGIISDIHGNLEALNVVLERIKGADKRVCLGDLVGYGPNPNECIKIVRDMNIPTVAGNHDKASIGEMDLTWFNRNARDAVIWTKKELSEENTEYLKCLPLTVEFDDFEIVHGSLRDPLSEYVTSIAEAVPTLEQMKKPLCFVGHSHKPLCVVKTKDGKYDGWQLQDGDVVRLKEFEKALVNVGGVGQPRDGDPRASYGVYDNEKKEVSIYRVPYNIERVQEKMREKGLPEPLIERLKYGV